MSSSAIPPTLDGLSQVLPPAGSRFDVTLAAARAAVGPSNDLTDPSSARAIRIWLNKWLCRIRYPRAGEPDRFVEELAAWWNVYSRRDALPAEAKQLFDFDDSDLDKVVSAYVDLRDRTAAVKTDHSVRTFGPTAAAKVCFFVRPNGVTAWDDQISDHVARDYAYHLQVCREWAVALVSEASGRGISSDMIGVTLRRPLSSVAKLIDEWLYMTITRGVSPHSV
jgi:hypothetical protein